MANTHTSLIQAIDAFLLETGMKESTFGRKAAGNTALVKRLRASKPILNTTDLRVRAWIKEARRTRKALGVKSC